MDGFPTQSGPNLAPLPPPPHQERRLETARLTKDRFRKPPGGWTPWLKGLSQNTGRLGVVEPQRPWLLSEPKLQDSLLELQKDQNWGFHQWGYPQFSSILMGFSLINQPAIGVPHLWKPTNESLGALHKPLGLFDYLNSRPGALWKLSVSRIFPGRWKVPAVRWCPKTPQRLVVFQPIPKKRA